MKALSRILLAEDEVDTLMGLQKTLMKEGYSVDIARDGLEAAEKVKRERFDVVVSDLKMPHIDGMELLHMTKEANRSIVFIIITGYGTVDSAVEAMRLGAADYINKPFSTQELISAIEKAVGEEQEESRVESKAKPQLAEAKRYESGNAWFAVQPDGTALVGASKAFYEEAGEIVYCDLPFEYEKVTRGLVCARMTTVRQHVPAKFLSPLSGTVVKVNEKMLIQPWLAQKDPYGEGWLFKIIPSRLEEELKEPAKQ